MQCFKRQDELSNLHPGGDLSLNAAMKLLVSPKKRKPQEEVEIKPEVEQLPEPTSVIEGSDVNSLMLGVAEALKRVTAEFNLFRLDDEDRESLRAWMVIIEEQLFGIRIMAGLPNPNLPPDDEDETPVKKQKRPAKRAAKIEEPIEAPIVENEPSYIDIETEVASEPKSQPEKKRHTRKEKLPVIDFSKRTKATGKSEAHKAVEATLTNMLGSL
jgi:hypothetical protein